MKNYYSLKYMHNKSKTKTFQCLLYINSSQFYSSYHAFETSILTIRSNLFSLQFFLLRNEKRERERESR